MVSCVRDVEIDLEDLPDRIVLNASVCPGKEVCAHLSKTWFIMDSVPDFELSDAKVRVYVNDEFQGLMRNDDLPEDSIHSRGQYVLPGCFVRQGDCLRISGQHDDALNLVARDFELDDLVRTLFPVSYACAKRIAEVLNTESSIKDGRYSAALRKGRACVAFDHVTFTYPGADEPVLKDVSFECRAGEVTAIIGRTGCGKSSILKLIPRLYDATVGHVYVDDMNVKQYKLNELRDLIGYIPQKNVLFSGDVASNLRFGDQDSSEEQWRQAAYIACADEFIEQKPDGYHAEIAQGGTNLSGGQRQRMAIARAVVKKPEIYLFDDSFSALDVKTDKTLRMRLRESMGDSTMLIVAQRVGSILDADRILVMEDGQIVGRGKHRELLHTCPLYREIAELQLGEEEVKHELECV